MSHVGTYLVTGVANEWSIAWATAERLLVEKQRCLVACLPANRGRVRRLLSRYGAEENLLDLDVGSDASLAEFSALLAAKADGLDGVLHSIAFADAEELREGILATTRDGFAMAMDRSVYSLLALSRGLSPLLRPGTSIVTLSYYGAQKCMPGYGIMGVAKAALESLVRYLASELGPRGVRVNAVSAGAMVTLSSSVFDDIESKVAQAAKVAPLRRATTQADVAGVVTYLFSSAAAAVSGQCLFADHGASSVGAVP